METVMSGWEEKFDKTTLDRGRTAFLNKKVVDLKAVENGYTAAVLGRERHDVSLKMMPSGAARMSCKCPAARGGRNCEHMSALMYAVEACKKAAEDTQKEAELMEQWRRLDQELRQKEELQKEEEKRRRREKQEAKLRRRREAEMKPEQKECARQEKAGVKRNHKEETRAAEEERSSEEARAAEEERRREEARTAEEKRRREEERAAEEKRRKEAEAAAAELQRQEQEREARRKAREERKAERARQKEERKRIAEEAARIEYEKRQAEEARREKIRQQKAEEARLRAEKKLKEQEAQRLAEEKRRKEAEEARLAEEKRRKKEEKARLAEEKRREEEERRMRQEELRAREYQRKIEEANRLDREKRANDYTLLGASWEEEADTQVSVNAGETMEKLEQYRYFNGTSIRNSVKIPAKIIQNGERLCRQGKIRLKSVMSGFNGWNSDRRGQMEAEGESGNRKFPLRLIFSRKDIISFECGCPQCYANYYAQYNVKESKCEYKAGALKLLEEYLNSHNIGDATDVYGHNLITGYDRKRANHIMSDVESQEESLCLLPRLIRKDGKLSISFKVGTNKLFVIKKLDVFCENVRTSATDTYGTSTQINHALSNFTESGKGWIRFIKRIVREEREFQQRLEESRYYYGKGKDSIGGTLNLFGWRLDELYENLADETIDFEDRDISVKKKAVLTCADRNPKVTMSISEDKIKGEKEFHGILVKGIVPDMYYGTDTAYYISDNHLNRVDRDFLDKLEPLANLAENDAFSFHIGRNRMSEFYNRVLPVIQDIADVTETDPDKFRSYLMPEAHFIFYLDVREQNAVCRVYAKYGDTECSVLDVLSDQRRKTMEPFRDCTKEEEILYHVMQWFPEVDWERKELHCGEDEALIYQVMKNGTSRLMELGEVRCTKRFLGHHVVKRFGVSVGVSVSSGLLDLEISTEDVPAQELLAILSSYRTRQKYYRLKDGSFVDLEDPSLEMLSELSEALHLKSGDLQKGSLKLPMYRTLYLDKLLEENDSVYSNRDSHFREVVKGFKTVRDADFEEPKSLSRRMRKYQKDGFKWLRTLEHWQFGGILADDMGLGKTLQVIAVLLAAKEEGKTGTSLVVTPASLVFNWAEEFEKFAPELNISLITGTQSERQKKIEDYQSADVLVTSYDLLKRDIAFYENKEFSYEIIDEAQYIKNHTTASAKAVKVVHSKIRYALTGTPIENRLSELWSIFDYLMPGFLYKYDVFKKEIESPIVKNNDEKAMKRLQKMVGPFILRRLKEDVLKDLPEKLEEHRYVRLGGTQQKVYDGQVVHMKESIARQDTEEFNKNKLRILAELTRLRQICCDPSLCFENYKGETAKLEACLDLIQSAMDGGHRMLVFSQFTSMLEILQRELDRLGIAYFTITGSTSKESRLRLVKEFNEGTVPVFLISLKAGGVGLNLTGADVVIHYDPWWNLAVQNQATDRAHRIGQTKKVTVYKLIAKHTIEEKIQKLQETKRDLAEQVMSGETGGLGALSRDEILELLEA